MTSIIVAVVAVVLAISVFNGQNFGTTATSKPAALPNPAASPEHACVLMPDDGSRGPRVRYGDVPNLGGVNLGLAKTLLRYAGFTNVVVQRDLPDDGGTVNDRDWYVQAARTYPPQSSDRARDAAVILSVRSYDKHGCWGQQSPG